MICMDEVWIVRSGSKNNRGEDTRTVSVDGMFFSWYIYVQFPRSPRAEKNMEWSTLRLMQISVHHHQDGSENIKKKVGILKHLDEETKDSDKIMQRSNRLERKKITVNVSFWSAEGTEDINMKLPNFKKRMRYAWCLTAGSACPLQGLPAQLPEYWDLIA